MACGCKKKKGLTAEKPLFFGQDDGEPSIQVRPTVTVAQQPPGETFWAAGDQLSVMLEAGWLVAT